MKTAMELLTADDVKSWERHCGHDQLITCFSCKMELVAKRAREEMRELAAELVYGTDDDDTYLKHIADAIRALPVEAKP